MAVLFTDREWLALFPAQPPPDPSLFRGPLPDPARELRAADALSFDALVSNLPDALLRAQVIAARRLEPLAARFIVRYSALGALTMALYGAAVAFNDGRYGGPQVATGFATIAAPFAFLIGTIAATRFREGSWARIYRPVGELKKGEVPAPAEDFSAHPFAGIARWTQLVSLPPKADAKDEENGGASAPTDKLTAHDPDDPDCPCGLATCLGDAPRSAGRQRVVQVVVQLVEELVQFVLTVWTPLVVLGASVWTSPWSAPIAALYCCVLVVHAPATTLGTTQTNLPALAVARRLHHRAVKIALEDLLSRCATGSEVPDPSTEERYVQLHWTLCATYTNHLHFLSNGQGLIVTALPLLAVCGIVNAAVGRCVPAWIALIFCYFAVWFAVPTAMVAVWNRNIVSVAELYRNAQERLVLLEPESASPAALERHGRLLGLLREGIAARRGTFMGLTVGLGTVRTYLATLFTVLLGLWTLLRGAGIAITVDSVCPG
ncbi:hypothetical protein DFJ74DRAFT_100746 [Hyaloraphidium curvatum]|nr:hypothetical protein DFJ74DRAFT_100746 [Hyaloraphidium curvatum]